MNKSRSSATVVIVDDTPENLRFLGDMLQHRGYRVLSFPSGEMALKALEKHNPDVILLDIMMPRMNGFQVCRALKKSRRLASIPVLFISALEDIVHKLQAFEEGGVDYITKPFNEAEVLSRVDTHIRIRDLQARLQRDNQELEERVEERTRELRLAHQRLQKLDRLKDEFFSMISHEFRTPANGLLGIGELLLDELEGNDELETYRRLFAQSGRRLSNLIEDATLLGNLFNETTVASEATNLGGLIQQLTAADLKARFVFAAGLDPYKVEVKGEPHLLLKAFEVFFLVGAAFCRGGEGMPPAYGRLAGTMLHLNLSLSAVELSHAAAREFFEVDTDVRAASPAENLGLKPVVGARILHAFGGNLQLIKSEGLHGHLEARFPVL